MIRQANLDDLKQLVKVHIACFPDSFSTQLGDKLLTKMYAEYIMESPELFLLAEEEGRVIGFVMGYYYDSEDCLRRFRRKNQLCFVSKTLWLLLTGNKPAWKKFKTTVRPTTGFTTIDSTINQYKETEMADLLSICVLGEYRGNGTANKLIDEYEKVLSERKRKICTLTVADINGRGISFYKKHAYAICREAEGCKTYYKVLMNGE